MVAPAESNAAPDFAILRVPAGLSAYCAATAAACLSTSSFGIGASNSLHADVNAFSDYQLVSATGATLFELADLQLKGRGLHSVAGDNHRLDNNASLLYEIQWQASHAEAPGGQLLDMTGAPMLLIHYPAIELKSFASCLTLRICTLQKITCFSTF